MFPDGNRHKSIPPKRKAYVFHIHGLPSAACGHKDLIPPTLIKDKNFLFIIWALLLEVLAMYYTYNFMYIDQSFSVLHLRP